MTTTITTNNGANNNSTDADQWWDDDAPWMFEDEEHITNDPGPWLFYATMGVAIVLVGIVLPISVYFYHERKKYQRGILVPTHDDDDDDEEVSQDHKAVVLENPQDDVEAFAAKIVVPSSSSSVEAFHDEEKEPVVVESKPNNPLPISFSEILACDHTSRRIVSYTIPFTCSSVSEAICQSLILGMLGYYVGTEEMTAYALLNLLFEVAQEFLLGPFEALPTVAANAVGAKNCKLAGQYLQLSFFLYILLGLPLFFGFFVGTESLLLWLNWASPEVAHHAQSLVRIIMIGKALEAFSQGWAELLNVYDHEVFVTVIQIFNSIVTISSMGVLILVDELTLERTGYVFIITNGFQLFLYIIVAKACQWLPSEFYQGLLLSNCSLCNNRAIRNLLRVCIPLSVSAVLESMEWTLLGVFAASMGTKEIAAWAIIGNIWEILNSLTYGIGDAAEIIVARHLGQGRGAMAKLSAYKSMFLAMMGSLGFTIIFILLIPSIPRFFTPNFILQDLIASCLPLLCMGYLLMTFGEISWFIVGATSRYDLGTYVHVVGSWGLTIPLGAFYTYYLKWDLQGLTSAVVIGYTLIGCVLSYCMFTTDWKARAMKANVRNSNGGNSTRNGNGNGMIMPYDEDDDWDDLDEKVRNAAAYLGYTKKLWNNDKEPPICDLDWKELTAEEQLAATVMGYDESKWNNETDNDDDDDDDDDDNEDQKYESDFGEQVVVEQVAVSPIEYDEDEYWDDLPQEIRDAATTLGYTKKMWNKDKEPPSCDLDWYLLTEEERQAATVMGYNEEKWNDEDD
mmetsp:Transcript_9078/g.13243  ORF Transcript_9078/g.13243 Transcript_9078/m.13243 type:complete len:793 (-) Transcript_9078:404-2782(-)|eukprot:CAMPEP_0194211852 /NCGR_PEP_ID=MMETSP0156-20130528/11275_1 /TAXON_ID=33649 /ORGANISM="Thalassionema nitzschioides, Strain L26-B" /LENGTH=792 /DNA_ID=CAMNT_0038939535 /DNA_START=92 /DNA_END=2470 /DNA_ORIENTATION=+